jgi:hypothetical protein
MHRLAVFDIIYTCILPTLKNHIRYWLQSNNRPSVSVAIRFNLLKDEWSAFEAGYQGRSVNWSPSSGWGCCYNSGQRFSFTLAGVCGLWIQRKNHAVWSFCSSCVVKNLWNYPDCNWSSRWNHAVCVRRDSSGKYNSGRKHQFTFSSFIASSGETNQRYNSGINRVYYSV